MQIYHQSINRPKIDSSEIIVGNNTTQLKEYIEDSISFQNKCNRRKAKVANSCKNTFHAKRWK